MHSSRRYSEVTEARRRIYQQKGPVLEELSAGLRAFQDNGVVRYRNTLLKNEVATDFLPSIAELSLSVRYY